VISVLLSTLLAVAAPVPTYLVERVVTAPGQSRRLSVYRDGWAALVREQPGEEKSVVWRQLGEVELRVISQVVEECYPELADGQTQVGILMGSSVELRVAPPDKPPVTMRFPLGAVTNLVTTRLGQALDGLERALATERVTREDLREWVPSVGDVVVLEDGRRVRVVEELESDAGQILRLVVGDGPANVFMSVAELRRAAVRKVKP